MRDIEDRYDVYLAGGFKTAWQDRVVERLSTLGFTCCDPRVHGLDDPKEYTAWDLEGVKRSDMVMAYLDNGNPYGANMALECGYAHALGKPVVFVSEKEPRGWSMLHALAVADEASLDDAIDRTITLLENRCRKSR